MTAAAPLFIGPAETEALSTLRDRAARRPVNMQTVESLLKTREGKRQHLRQMQAQTIQIPGPFPFDVTFSIEIGHGKGTCRHLSMSVVRPNRVPHPAAVWMVAELLGFSGGLEACETWPERFDDQGNIAINVIQPVSVAAEGRKQ